MPPVAFSGVITRGCREPLCAAAIGHPFWCRPGPASGNPRRRQAKADYGIWTSPGQHNRMRANAGAIAGAAPPAARRPHHGQSRDPLPGRVLLDPGAVPTTDAEGARAPPRSAFFGGNMRRLPVLEGRDPSPASARPENTYPSNFGFRSGSRGTHTSRTIMFHELAQLLAALPSSAPFPDYQRAAIEENVLGKRTSSTRCLTIQRLHELYGLDPSVTLFRVLRSLWDSAAAGHPLLALLCALARDPLLRATADPVLRAPLGTRISAADLDLALAAVTEGRLNASSRGQVARNAASSWTQSGHLSGRATKTRSRPVATAACAAYALALGYLTGLRGRALLSTLWTRALDLPDAQVLRLASDAARLGLLDLRHAGGVVEVRFPQLLTPAEIEACREPD